MITGLRGSYRWTPVTETPPEKNVPVLLARLPRIEGEGVVEPGYWSGTAYRSDYEGPVDDVTHWAHFPSPPVTEQMRRVLDELAARKGAEHG